MDVIGKMEVQPAKGFVLLFASLMRQGCGIAVPCDSEGHVDMDHMPERMRLSYLGARAMIGREYAFPVVEPCS